MRRRGGCSQARKRRALISVASHLESDSGTKLPIRNVRSSVANGGKADLGGTARGIDAIDPEQT
jgi:hypothetical protein